MVTIDLRRTTDLTPIDYADLTVLFDGEYADDWGPWNPKRRYGYVAVEWHAGPLRS